jgi:molybdate transport system ATP-binding protein
MSLEVRIRKSLGPDFILDVDFRSQGCLGILGSSGCGKSMTLKCLAGVEKPDCGKIVFNGRVFFDSECKIDLKPQERRVGFLFQNYALFPTMNVRDNVRIGIRGDSGRKRVVCENSLELFQLGRLGRRLPSQLSGGQQQRVALARMLSSEPELILLDEPFSALDYHLREQMQITALGILDRYPDAILVTHNRDEAYKLCDSVLVLENGKVLGKDATAELFHNPRNVGIARLTGCKNISRARRLSRRKLYAMEWGVELETAGEIGLDVTHVGIRAHDIVPAGDDVNRNTIRIKPIRVVKELFETVLLFSNAAIASDAAAIWWKYGRNEPNGSVRRVVMPPERLLLLTDDPKGTAQKVHGNGCD